MRQNYEDSLTRASRYIFYGLLVYMPFHIPLSTWLGTTLGLLGPLKAAKDVVLVAGFLITLFLSLRQPGFREWLRDKLIWLIGGYVLLMLLLALLHPTDVDAEVLGIVYNTRFLLFFLYASLLTRLYAPDELGRTALRLVLASATVVLFFGVLQYALLPSDVLTHLGYARSNGVLPAFFIDDKPDLERVMSTLRDPNSLGSYVLIIGSVCLAFLLRTKDRYARQMAWGLLALGLLCLWFTFSRSAWLGALAVLLTTVVVAKKVGRRVLIGLAGVALVGLVLMAATRKTYFVQNVILHADESTVLEDPNELRVRFWRESVEAIAAKPLGHGPGTAGLASIRNNVQGTVLNENYYLQIAHEAGLPGLGLFLTILILAGLRLYRLSGGQPLALALFAGLIGLCLTNFLVHIWSNEAVAYTWWGLAGLALGVKTKRSAGS